jgi:glycosyltransferase involved in cell wall biosynthesis
MKLSIIVPVYNVERYIRECLESIKTQKYKDFECIMIDDGSTDKSGEICETYARTDSRFHVIHQLNKGVNFARDTALQQATGEYVGFVDADDYIDKTMFSVLMDSALKSKADIVICNWWEIGEDFCKPSTHYTIAGSFAKTLAMQYLAADDISSHLWNKIFKRHLLEKPQVLFTAKNMGDYSWMHHIFHKAVEFFYVDKNLYFYRYRADSIIHNTNLSKMIQRYVIAKERRDFYKLYYPQMLAFANVGAFKQAWNLCKNYACPLVPTEKERYLEADSFVKEFANEYIKALNVGKKERMSLWLYAHFTNVVRMWKSLKYSYTERWRLHC